MKKIIIVSLLILMQASFAAARNPRIDGTPPAPRLIVPLDKVVLSKGEDLEFRWSTDSFGSGPWVSDFRIYKGTSTVASALILKEKVPQGVYSIRVPSDLFEDGQHYAWSVRQVGTTKSLSGYSIFRVEFRK